MQQPRHRNTHHSGLLACLLLTLTLLPVPSKVPHSQTWLNTPQSQRLQSSAINMQIKSNQYRMITNTACYQNKYQPEFAAMTDVEDSPTEHDPLRQ